MEQMNPQYSPTFTLNVQGSASPPLSGVIDSPYTYETVKKLFRKTMTWVLVGDWVRHVEALAMAKAAQAAQPPEEPSTPVRAEMGGGDAINMGDNSRAARGVGVRTGE